MTIATFDDAESIASCDSPAPSIEQCSERKRRLTTTMQLTAQMGAPTEVNCQYASESVSRYKDPDISRPLHGLTCEVLDQGAVRASAPGPHSHLVGSGRGSGLR